MAGSSGEAALRALTGHDIHNDDDFEITTGDIHA
jgi:hypothetical protein